MKNNTPGGYSVMENKQKEVTPKDDVKELEPIYRYIDIPPQQENEGCF